MQKMTDLVTVQDKPYAVTISAVEYDVPGDYGDQNKVTISSNGEDYQWYIKTASFDRIFPMAIEIGAEYTIIKNSPKGNSKYPFFTAEKTGAGSGVIAAPKAPVSAAESDAKTAAAKEAALMKTDLKEKSIILQAVLKAVVAPTETDITNAKKITADLARWVKSEAYRWYVEENMNTTTEAN